MVHGPLVVRGHLPGGPRAKVICQGYKHTNRPILAIFHDTIFSGSPRPRDQICKWSSSLKRL